MSEYALEDSASNISMAVYDWLEAEINTSGVERNNYLDNYNRILRGMRGGWDHPDNFSARKLEAHTDRLPFWYEAFREDPSDDYQAARMVFAGLMQVSGSYRSQCYLEAAGAEDYSRRRREVIGVNIQSVVRHRLRQLLPAGAGFVQANISVEGLGEEVRIASETSLREASVVYQRTSRGYDLGLEASMSARKMQEAQALWLDFTTDCVALAAKIRKGKLAAVPFLEPRSITDQSGTLRFPLRKAVDWDKIIAAVPAGSDPENS